MCGWALTYTWRPHQDLAKSVQVLAVFIPCEGANCINGSLLIEWCVRTYTLMSLLVRSRRVSSASTGNCSGRVLILLSRSSRSEMSVKLTSCSLSNSSIWLFPTYSSYTHTLFKEQSSLVVRFITKRWRNRFITISTAHNGNEQMKHENSGVSYFKCGTREEWQSAQLVVSEIKLLQRNHPW